jgi:hypothetical protein
MDGRIAPTTGRRVVSLTNIVARFDQEAEEVICFQFLCVSQTCTRGNIISSCLLRNENSNWLTDNFQHNDLCQSSRSVEQRGFWGAYLLWGLLLRSESLRTKEHHWSHCYCTDITLVHWTRRSHATLRIFSCYLCVEPAHPKLVGNARLWRAECAISCAGLGRWDAATVVANPTRSAKPCAHNHSPCALRPDNIRVTICINQ